MAYSFSPSNDNQNSEFAESIVQIKRVSKKTKGGNQMSFSALTVVGDRKGKVGVGLGKGPDVSSCIKKGFATAKKNMINVPLDGQTITHQVEHKYGAALVLMKPAKPGTGMIVGGAVRTVLEAAGVQDVVGKILGTNNKISNVYCTIEALKQLKPLNEKKD